MTNVNSNGLTSYPVKLVWNKLFENQSIHDRILANIHTFFETPRILALIMISDYATIALISKIYSPRKNAILQVGW